MDRILRYMVFHDGQAQLVDNAQLKAEMVASMTIYSPLPIREIMVFFHLTEPELWTALHDALNSQTELSPVEAAILRKIRENNMSLETLTALCPKPPSSETP